MNRIVNSIQIQLLSNFSDLHLALASTFLGHHTLLYIGLGIPNNLAQHLCET